jgi:hypothetical protein
MKKFVSAALLCSCVALAIGCSGPAPVQFEPIEGADGEGALIKLLKSRLASRARDLLSQRSRWCDAEIIEVQTR